MSAEGIVAIIVALGGAIIAIMNTRHANRQTDILWEAKVRIGETQALKAGIATKDSPFTLTPAMAKAFEDSGMAVELREFYEAEGLGLTDAQFLRKLEQAFGERMLKEISKPLRQEHEACMVAAMHVARSDLNG